MHQDVTDLTPQQNQAIDLYMSGKTTGNIAAQLGVHRQTLWRWRQLPAFQALKNDLQQRRREEMREHMNEIMRLCLVTLERALQDAENPKRYNPLSTAYTILKMIHPGTLLEVVDSAIKPE